MKLVKNLFTLLFVGMVFVSYAQKQDISVSASTIKWKGEKIVSGHDGLINFKSGSVTMNKGKLTGGTFEVDMTSIIVSDLAAGKGKEKLEGHLKADDFFGVDKFPTASINFKKVTSTGKDAYNVMADLTIKGITKPIEFPITFNGKTGSAKLSVDRTKYDIKYGSGSFFDNLGDKAIKDNFDLDIQVSVGSL